MTDSLEGQGYLIANGTEGFGPSVIRLASWRGAAVVFTARAECAPVADKIVATCRTNGNGGQVSWFTADPHEEQEVDAVVDSALERLPALNGLILFFDACALQPGPPLAEVSVAEWNHVLATELRVPFMLTRRIVEEYLVSQVSGRIVYVTYVREQLLPRSPAHAAAVAGLHALVRCTAKEFGRREIACNAVVIHPGLAFPNEEESCSAPAETILFLASSESSFVNGEILNIGERFRG